MPRCPLCMGLLEVTTVAKIEADSTSASIHGYRPQPNPDRVATVRVDLGCGKHLYSLIGSVYDLPS